MAKRRFVLSVISLILIVTSGSVWALPCKEIIRRQEATRQVVEQYQDKLPIRIFTKEVNGLTRTAIVLGETHIKTKKAKVAADNLTANALMIGFENYQPAAEALGGEAFMAVLSKYRGFLKLVFRLDETYSSFETPEDLKSYLLTLGREELIANLESGFEMDFDSISSDEIKGTNYFHRGQVLITGEEMLAVLRPGDASPSVKIDVDRVFVDLEKGYRPNRAARIQAWAFRAYIFVELPYFALFYLFPQVREMHPAIHYAVISPVLFFGTDFYIYTGLHRRFGNKPWFKWLTPISSPASKSRNDLMGHSIQKAFLENDDIPELIGIVGAAHLTGVGDYLMTNGWSELSKDQYIRSSAVARPQ